MTLAAAGVVWAAPRGRRQSPAIDALPAARSGSGRWGRHRALSSAPCATRNSSLPAADWCPDCVRSTGAVRAAVAAAPGARLLEVDVAAVPAEWKTPAHPLRSDPRFRLSGIPTLVAWRNGAVAAKLGAAGGRSMKSRVAAAARQQLAHSPLPSALPACRC